MATAAAATAAATYEAEHAAPPTGEDIDAVEGWSQTPGHGGRGTARCGEGGPHGEDDEEAEEADAGKNFVSVKPWLGSIRGAAPTGWTDLYRELSNERPAVALELEHVFGHKVQDVRRNARWVDADTLVFFAAAVGVVQDASTSRQYFYQRHTTDITAMALHKPAGRVATGAVGTAAWAPICIWDIDLDEHTTAHIREIRSPVVQFAVDVLAFGDDGRQLIAVGRDFNHTISVIDVASGGVVFSVASPGRNTVFDTAFFPRRFCDDYTLRMAEATATASTGGWIGRLHPEDYFITAGWKHLYVWSLTHEVSGRTTTHRYKAKLKPYLKRGRRVAAAELGQESFTAVAFSVHHILAAAVSSVIYLFDIAPPGADGVIKNVVMHHAVVVNPRRKGVVAAAAAPAPGPQPGMLERMWGVLRHLRSADTLDFIDDLKRFGLALLGSFDPKKAATAAHGTLLRILAKRVADLTNDADDLFDACERASGGGGALLDATHALLRGHAVPFAATVERAVGTAAELQAAVEGLWAEGIREGHAATETLRKVDLSGVPGAPPPPSPRASPPGHPSGARELMHPDTLLQQRVRWTARLRRAELPIRDLLAETRRRLKDTAPHGGAGANTTAPPGGARGVGRKREKSGTSASGADTGVLCLACVGGRYIAAGGADGVVSWYDLYSGAAEPWTADMIDAVEPDAVVRCSSPLWQRDVNPESGATCGPADPANSVRTLDVLGAGERVACGTRTGTILVMDVTPTGAANVYGEVEAHCGSFVGARGLQGSASSCHGEVWGLSAHPFAPLAATCGDDGSVRVWDVALRTQLLHRFFAPLVPATCQYSPDGHVLAVGFRCGAFALYAAGSLTRLWPPAEQPLGTARYRRFDIQKLRFSPNRRYLAVCGGKFVDVYELRYLPHRDAIDTGLMVGVAAVSYFGTCRGASGTVYQVDWSQDSSLLQTCNKSYELLYYDISLRRGHRIAQLTHAQSLADVHWTTFTSPFGWSVQGIFPKYAGGDDVNCTCKSNSGNYLIAGNDACALMLFNYPCVGSGYDDHGKLTRRAQHWAMAGHASHITNVGWLYDDSKVVSVGGADCSLLVWRVVPVAREDTSPATPAAAAATAAGAASAPAATESPAGGGRAAAWGTSRVNPLRKRSTAPPPAGMVGAGTRRTRNASAASTSLLAAELFGSRVRKTSHRAASVAAAALDASAAADGFPSPAPSPCASPLSSAARRTDHATPQTTTTAPSFAFSVSPPDADAVGMSGGAVADGPLLAAARAERRRSTLRAAAAATDRWRRAASFLSVASGDEGQPGSPEHTPRHPSLSSCTGSAAGGPRRSTVGLGAAAPLTAEHPGGRPVQRPQSKRALAQSRGPVDRGTFVHRCRAQWARERRRVYEAWRTARNDDSSSNDGGNDPHAATAPPPTRPTRAQNPRTARTHGATYPPPKGVRAQRSGVRRQQLQQQTTPQERMRSPLAAAWAQKDAAAEPVAPPEPRASAVFGVPTSGSVVDDARTTVEGESRAGVAGPAPARPPAAVQTPRTVSSAEVVYGAEFYEEEAVGNAGGAAAGVGEVDRESSDDDPVLPVGYSQLPDDL